MQKNAEFFRRFDKEKRKRKVQNSVEFNRIVQDSYLYDYYKPINELILKKLRDAIKERKQHRTGQGLEDVKLNTQEKQATRKPRLPSRIAHEEGEGDLSDLEGNC